MQSVVEITNSIGIHILNVQNAKETNFKNGGIHLMRRRTLITIMEYSIMMILSLLYLAGNDGLRFVIFILLLVCGGDYIARLYK